MFANIEFKKVGHHAYALVINKAPEKASYVEDKSLKIIKYGARNDMPEQLIDINAMSPINNACLLTCSRFIYGDGFIYPETIFGKSLEKTGLDGHLLEKVSYDKPFIGYATIRVHYNAGGYPVKFSHIDPSTVRFAIPDQGATEPTDAMISSNWKKPNEKGNKPFVVQLFDPVRAKATIQAKLADGDMAVAEWFGQLLVVKTYQVGYNIYPQPRWMNALNWVYVDGQVGVFQANNIDNGFMPSVILIHPDEPTGTDESGTPKKEAINNALNDRFAGAKNAGKILNLFKKSDSGQAIEVLRFDATSNFDLFNTIEELINKQIGKAWGIPNALINIETPGQLGNSKEIAEATQFYQNTQIKIEQNAICEALNEVMKYMPGWAGEKIEIANSVPVNFFDAEKISVLAQYLKPEAFAKILGYDLSDMKEVSSV